MVVTGEEGGGPEDIVSDVLRQAKEVMDTPEDERLSDILRRADEVLETLRVPHKNIFAAKKSNCVYLNIIID